MRRLAPVLVALLAGCGGAATGGSAPGGTLYDQAAVGKLSWRASGDAFVTTFVARRATAVVRVTADGEARQATLQPGKSLSSPAGAERTVWRIVQSTEPKTLLVVARVERPSAAGEPKTCIAARSIPHEAMDWQRRVTRKTRCG